MHLKALDDQFLKYAEFRRDFGMVPKNVAAQTTKSFVFKAHSGKGGSVTTVPVTSAAHMQEIERAESKEITKGSFNSEEDEAIRAQFESEFPEGVAAQTAKK